jgi:hypothetical protein
MEQFMQKQLIDAPHAIFPDEVERCLSWSRSLSGIHTIYERARDSCEAFRMIFWP